MNKQTYSIQKQTNHTASKERSIQGKVVLKGTAQGIPNLIVEGIKINKTNDFQRLGSVITDSNGSFKIDIPIRPGMLSFLWHRNRELDVTLFVLTPDRTASTNTNRVLFRSEPRKTSAFQEAFLVELPRELLIQAEIPADSIEKAKIDIVTDDILINDEENKKVQEAIDTVSAPNLNAVIDRRNIFRAEIMDKLKTELTGVSEKERQSDRFVANDQDIEQIHLAAVKTDVNKLVEKTENGSTPRFGKIRFKGRLSLSERERSILIGSNTEPVILTEKEMEEKLGYNLNKPGTVYRRTLEPDPCRPLTSAERCLDEIQTNRRSGATGKARTEVPGNNGTSSLDFDKAESIEKLLRRQTSPEEPVEFGPGNIDLEPPLTPEGVSEAISQVVFAPGPADTPSFYDINDLQVAFEPVWQEALDDKFLQDVEDVYDQVVEKGGTPARQRIRNIIDNGAAAPIFDELVDGFRDIRHATDAEVPPNVVSAVLISLDEWQILPLRLRNQLKALATEINRLQRNVLRAIKLSKPEDRDLGSILDLLLTAYSEDVVKYRAQIQILTADTERIVAHARQLLIEQELKKPFRPTQEIIEQLRNARNEAYPFRCFAASSRYRSVNFGIMVTYRQQWKPVSYQVGELVSTIPLAPKEMKKFSRKTIIKTKRTQSEIENNLMSRKGESEEKNRAEAEIVSRATAKTNFSLSNSGTFQMGEGPLGGSMTSTSTFTRDTEKHSQSVKKEFREAILKTAEEYKNERKIEVSTEESLEVETTESGEIQNPNDEIPVTFLFYELQRRFTVSEKLHRLQSVVLVAQEVPRPSAIDKTWVIKHDWILNRVLLDDSFRPALTYISTTLISEEVVLRELYQAIFRQRKLVEQLKEDVADRRALAGLRYSALQRQIERTATSAGSGGGGGGGILGGITDLAGSLPLVGSTIESGINLITGGGDSASEAAQIREGAARDAYDRERQEEQELSSRLLNALSMLESMQRNYADRLGQHLRQVAQCERLITHIAQNILVYMQAIWSYEPDDQRFLRLRNVPVPVFEKDKDDRKYVINARSLRSFIDLSRAAPPFETLVDVGIKAPPGSPQDIRTKPLSEVADINRPLGFMGNYMIFPMTESNPITDFMMDPYVTLAEGEYGVSDPDPLGNMSLEEFSEYVCCLKHYYEEHPDPGGADPFEELKPFLRETLKKLLELSIRNNEEVIVPTDSLYIEALPGAHTVMERFKHLHRQIDVKAAQEGVRREAIDNVRRAQRILDEQLEDPDIEAKYVFEGDGTATILPPGSSASVPPDKD